MQLTRRPAGGVLDGDPAIPSTAGPCACVPRLGSGMPSSLVEDLDTALARELAAHAEPDAMAWLLEQVAAAATSDTLVRTAWARVARRFGEASPGPDALTQRDIARLLLLRAALAPGRADGGVELVTTLLRAGEIGEQVSLLRGLALLPTPQRFVDVAVEACRTNAVAVFAALAIDNPYPARYLPDAALRQLVLKAIFIGVPVRRIDGLAARVDAELARMVADFADERRAAGRPVPDDVDYVCALAQEQR